MLTKLSNICIDRDGRMRFKTTHKDEYRSTPYTQEWFTNRDGEGLFYDTGREIKQVTGTSQLTVYGNAGRAHVLFHFLKDDDGFIRWCDQHGVNRTQSNAVQYYRDELK